jgi:hypothetical protein
MKRPMIYILGAGLVLAAAGAIVLAVHSSNSQDDKTSNQPTSSATSPSVKKACAIFTLSDAKKLLGDTAKGGENGAPSSSADLAVSLCTYTQDAGSNAPVSTSPSATLLVRLPQTPRGINSNHNQFGPLRPESVQPISGYGDGAYWDPQFGQLDILKNNNWYVLSYGPITPTDRTLAQTEQMANLLISKM